MTRQNEWDYSQRDQDDRDSRYRERSQQAREQSDRGPYQSSGEPRAQLGGRDDDRWDRQREESRYLPNQERTYPSRGQQRGYDRGSLSQPGYAQRNYDESDFHRAGYDRSNERQFGSNDLGRDDIRQSHQGQVGQNYQGQGYAGQSQQSDFRRGNPAPEAPRFFSDPVRADWPINDSRGGFARGNPNLNSGRGGFFGKGPKGYVRSDDRIREDVCDRLSADDELDASDITVSVSQGEVTLEGSVSDRRSKHRAEDISDAINGVKDVHNRLRTQKGVLQEVGDKLLGRDGDEHAHHAGSGTRNAPTASAATSPRSGTTQPGTSENHVSNSR